MDAVAEVDGLPGVEVEGGLPEVAVVRDRREVVVATIPREEEVVVLDRNRKVGRVPRGTKGEDHPTARGMAPGQAIQKAVPRDRATLSRGAATTPEGTARRVGVPRPALPQ